jgi:hypothetical protein
LLSAHETLNFKLNSFCLLIFIKKILMLVVLNYFHFKNFFSITSIRDFQRLYNAFNDYPPILNGFIFNSLLNFNPRTGQSNEGLLGQLHLVFQANILLDLHNQLTMFQQNHQEVLVTECILLIQYLLFHEILYILLGSDRHSTNILLIIAAFFDQNPFLNFNLFSHDELSRSLRAIANLYLTFPQYNIQLHQFSEVVEECFRIFFRALNNETAPPSDLVVNFWHFCSENHVQIQNLRSSYGLIPILTLIPSNDDFNVLLSGRNA